MSFTAQEVSKHCVPGDLWVVLNGQVYNLSEFLAFHPGGKEPLLKGAGHDVTAYFNKIHKHSGSSLVEEALEKFYIGKVVTD